MKRPQGWLQPSGGVFYHYAALKYKNSLWKPFTLHIHKWLESWPLFKSKICLIGPSGGYSLSYDFLSQFKEIVCFDIDPLAPFLFRKKFPKLNPIWIRKDHLQFQVNQGLSPSVLKNLVQNFPDHAFLFCNLLGQIPHIIGSTQVKISPISVMSTLKKTNWASFHDLYSFPLTRNISLYKDIEHNTRLTLHPFPFDIDCHPVKRNCRENFTLPKDLSDWLPTVLNFSRQKKSLQLFDHETIHLFPLPRSSQIFIWKRLPKYIHLVETLHQAT